ncbi:MAG: alpha,alpha-phosphotrehalase [Lachnospiraceae bacterium]|nr:alpha,alpha-phosphotrehalase [Lachnospiraceae bacterium]
MTGLKESIIYQIYPKSFYDSNGDGIGDIRGIIEKLDYIKSLGVNYIWSTPFFVSPLNDNGYDVEDYKRINPIFGTMEDVEELIEQAGKRGIGLMFDMVFNHTSTNHEWFQKALSGDEKYMDYYIFKDGDPDTPPTNWESKFGGPAWEYVPSLKKWYLHLFDVTQADLNWKNPQVREELKNVIRFWMEKGVKGFRFDVVNLISKPALYENDRVGDGRRFYTDGPQVHEFLKELTADTGMDKLITVGEMSSTSLENCIRYSNPAEKELSMCFNFHHLKTDYKDGNKWDIMDTDYRKLKELLSQWQIGMEENNGWHSLFWCNHDQPRIVSRMGNENKYWKQSAKMLAGVMYFMRGTPYIYQGEELGMLSSAYKDIDEYKDVESINYYHILLEEGKSKEEAIEILKKRSRDNGRSPMQWDASENAGFTVGEPWIGVPECYSYLNVEAEEKDEDSILNYYKKIIQLRKDYRVIQEGTIEFLCQDQEEVFVYRRVLGQQQLLVVNNFTGQDVALMEPVDSDGFSCILHNYDEKKTDFDFSRKEKGKIENLRPYESLILYKEKA